MNGRYVDRHGRIYSVMTTKNGFCAAVFDRCCGYQRLNERDAPFRMTLEEAQIDLDDYAQRYGIRPTDVFAIRYSIHEGATRETLRLFDVTSGTNVQFGFSQLVEQGVVYVSNRVPGSVYIPGVGYAGDTFYLVGEGDEQGDYRDLPPAVQKRWMQILRNVEERGCGGEMA